MEALWLKSLGLSHKEIVRLTGISPNTLRQNLYDYLEGGIEKLKEINFNRPIDALYTNETFYFFPLPQLIESIRKIYI